MLVCDAETGMIITFHMERNDQAPIAFRDHLLEFFQSFDILPSQVAVVHPVMNAILRPICHKLGIDLRTTRRLPAVDYAMSEMFSLC